MTLGQIIKEYREKNHLSQRQFALRCKVSNGYISMLEEGRNPKNHKPIIPSLATMRKLAKSMDMTLNDLMNQADDMEISLSDKKTPSEESEDVVIVSRNGNRLVHHLSPEQMNLIENMIAQFDKNNYDI